MFLMMVLYMLDVNFRSRQFEHNSSNLTVHSFSLCGVEVDEDIDRAPLGIKL